MKKKRGRKTKKPNKKYFEMLYYNDSIKASDLADLFKVKEQTIYNWANKFRKENTK